jgi:putative flippase GtrA
VFSKDLIVRIVKFGLVGLIGTIVNEFSFYYISKLLPIIFSLIFAIEISILFNFILHENWTFRDRKKRNAILNRLLKFHITSIVGGIIQYSIVIVLIIVGWKEQATNILLSSYSSLPTLLLLINLIGILMAFSIRFLLSLKFVWTK